MSMLAHAGSFNIDTSKTAGQTQAISGLGFQPKIVMFWWSGSAATGDSVAGGTISYGFGAAVSSSNRFCIANIIEDAQGTTDSYMYHANAECIRIYTDTGTLDGLADYASHDADGFTLTIDDQFSVAYRISYLALGGTDLTNVTIGSYQRAEATGNLAISGVGFQPDALIVSGAFRTSVPDGGAVAYFSLGWGVDSSNQGVVGLWSADNVATSDATRYGYNGEIYAPSGQYSSGPRDTLVSLDADGFTINQLEASAFTRTYCHYIALKGGQYAVGELTTRTDGNDIAETPGFTPVAILFASHNAALNTQNSKTDHARMSIGAATAIDNRTVQAISDEDNLADSETAYGNYDSAVYAHVTDDGIVGLMDVKSIDATGFTNVMDDTDPSACWVTYLTIGAAAGAAAPAPSVQDSTSISESVTLAISTCTISVDDSISVSDSPTVSITGGEPEALSISVDDSVSVSDNVALAISTCTISVDDSTSVDDNVALAINISTSAQDSISIADSGQAETSSPTIQAQDSVSVSEDTPAVAVAIGASVSDTTTLDDSVQISMLDMEIDTSDSVAVVDLPVLNIPTSIDVNDALAVSEDIAVTVSDIIISSVQDSISVTDTPSLVIPITITTDDSISVAEGNASALSDLAASVQDSISVTDETPGLSIVDAGVIAISVSDNTIITDTLAASIDIGIAISENIGLSEDTNVSQSLFISVSDDVQILEDVSGQINIFATGNDVVSVTDDILAELQALAINLLDSVTLSENSTVGTPFESNDLSISVSDVLSIVDSPLANIIIAIQKYEAVSVSETVHLSRLGAHKLDIALQNVAQSLLTLQNASKSGISMSNAHARSVALSNTSRD